MDIKQNGALALSFIVGFYFPLIVAANVCPFDIAATNNLMLMSSRNPAISKHKAPPLFSERHINIYEVYAAAFSAIAYSGRALADGVNIRKCAVRHNHSQLCNSMPNSIPYYIDGVNLTNMSIRVFGFSVYPPLSTNRFECFMVSFWRQKSFLYALYVNSNYDNVGISIQQCAWTTDFLENAVPYPYLDITETEAQQKFSLKIHKRMFGNEVMLNDGTQIDKTKMIKETRSDSKSSVYPVSTTGHSSGDFEYPDIEMTIDKL